MIILLSQTSFAQKVLVESLNESVESTDTAVKTDSKPSSDIVSLAVAKKQVDANLDIFKNLQAFDSFEKVIQSFPHLSCKNEFVSPLVLKCYVCSFQSRSTKWELEFHRREVGDESCELASISKIESNSSKFDDNRNKFDEMLKRNFSVSLTKAGSKWLAGTEEEDFQVFKEKVFSNAKNSFVEKLRIQMSYLHSLINQEKINNAIDQMKVGFSSLYLKAIEDFRDELFSEDSTDKRLKNITSLQRVLHPALNKDEPTETNEDEKNTELSVDSKIELLSSLVFHHSLEAKQNYKQCYVHLVKKLLPMEASEEKASSLVTSNLFKVAKMEVEELVENTTETPSAPKAEAKEAKEMLAEEEVKKAQSKVLISFNSDYKQKKDKDVVPYCKVFTKLLKPASNESPGIDKKYCQDITGNFLKVEKAYKDFFKGDELDSFKMYRALLVRDLMLASESEYFRALEVLAKMNEAAKPDTEKLKEQSQKIEFNLSKVSDYQEELVGLLPYLEESFKMRRDWLLKGISSKDVFPICDSSKL